MFKFLRKPESTIEDSTAPVEPRLGRKPRMLASRNVSTSSYEFYNVLVHPDHSEEQAKALVAELIEVRKDLFRNKAEQYPILRRDLGWATEYFFSAGMIISRGMNYNASLPFYSKYELVYADEIISVPKRDAVVLTDYADVTNQVQGVLSVNGED